jgi:hypothetical protein
VWYAGHVHLFVRVLLMVLLCSAAARADVVVFDRGGGSARTAAARVAAEKAGETVLTVAEAAELEAAYAGGCSDADCYSRAGVAGSVGTIVLVEKAALTLIDVEHATARTRPAATADIGTVLARLREPLRWGTLDGGGLPAGSVVLVGGAVYDGADLAPGNVDVVVRTPDGVTHSLQVVVIGGQSARVQLPLQAVTTPRVSTTSSAVPLYAIPLLATGGALTVAGLTVGGITEVLAQQALNDLQAGKPANLRALETVEVVAFAAAAVGIAGLVSGALMLFNSSDTSAGNADSAATPAPDSP